MLAHFLPALCASVFAAGGCQQDNPAGIRARPQAEVLPQRDTALVPVADTYIRQGRPNQNQGAEPILRLESLLKNRSLLRWDQQALAQAVAGGTLTAARLELTIADLRDNWSAAGRTIELHRMTQAWTELGATWNCAVDSVPDNLRADCGGPTAWDMDHSAAFPWVAAPTATALLRNDQTGVVTFDVTSDVQAWLAGQQPNYGWILKKTVEVAPGKVDFGSRESGAGPRLVLRIETMADTTRPPVPESMDFPDDSLHTVEDTTNPGDILYRTLAEVVFDDSVSGITIRAFLRKYQAVVVGGTSAEGGYILQFPDPGPTLDALRAFLRRMIDEPGVFGVLSVGRSSKPPEPDGRYPTDGPNLGRSSWFDPNSAYTWAGLAIRAPLAWGCENGLYGSAGPPVAIVELRSGQLHDDLSGSLAVGYVPGPFGATELAPESALVGDVRHANAVAGLIGATGDNGKGAAGMVWGGRLRLYALEPAGRLLPWQSVNVVFRSKVLPRLAADGARIVNLSVAIGGPPADSQAQRFLLRDLSRFLRANPRVLVVKSTGNKRSVLDVDSLLRVRADNGLGLLAALARLRRDSAAFRDRILLVSGTQRGGALWDDASHGQGANFVRGGVTEIAAPAAQVATLDNPALGEDAILQSGTSFSAALVSGVAAQLLAMDATLTPAEVKDYILRGDSAPRLSTTTGAMVPAVAVRGAPETIYQLDAYGALTLLSRERPGTPICGFPVSVTPDLSSVVLERPGAPFTITPPGQGIGSVSVAQGGRLISVTNGDPETGAARSLIMDQTGRIQSVLPDTQRTFLERDTLDTAWDYSLGLPSYTLRRAAGGPPQHPQPLSRIPLQPADSCDGYSWLAYLWLAFSPSGDSVAVDVKRCALDGRPVQIWMVPTNPTGTARLVESYPPVPPDGDWTDRPWDIGWSHDSRRVIYFTTRERPFGSPGVTLLVSSVGGDGVPHDVVLPNMNLWSQTFSADDSAVVALEETGSWSMAPCVESRRDPATWAILSGPRDVGDCLDAYLAYRMFPNAPPVRAGVSRGAPASSAPTVQGVGGFGLDAPATALERRARAARGLFPTTLRVQVN
jgi:hypothetical protein